MVSAADLAGNWDIERAISSFGTMTGTASFTQLCRSELDYEETGHLLARDGRRFAASRRYRYVCGTLGIAIFFDEPALRLFQQVTLVPRGNALVGDAVHACAPDVYKSHYAFHLPGAFHIAHTVTGPRKADLIHTSYRRRFASP